DRVGEPRVHRRHRGRPAKAGEEVVARRLARAAGQHRAVKALGQAAGAHHQLRGLDRRARLPQRGEGLPPLDPRRPAGEAARPPGFLASGPSKTLTSTARARERAACRSAAADAAPQMPPPTIAYRRVTFATPQAWPSTVGRGFAQSTSNTTTWLRPRRFAS